MSSNAFTNHLLTLLQDADAVLDAQNLLNATMVPPPAPGTLWGIGSLNRAAVVMLVSAWEVYIEQVAIEAVEAPRPPGPGPLGSWPALYASVKDSAGQLHQPNVQHVKKLISGAIGLEDITASWAWSGVTVGDAHKRLEDAVGTRNRLAHGARLPVSTAYANGLQVF